MCEMERVLVESMNISVGSTEGVGRQTAIDLAAHPNNHVIIHGRTLVIHSNNYWLLTRKVSVKTDTERDRSLDESVKHIREFR